jgi:flagellar M-ring protein FliF
MVQIKGADGKVVEIAAPAEGQPIPSAADLAPPTQTEQMIELSQFNGAIQARSIEKVGEVASKNPQESVAILRQWIHS